jgi:hypothetical protein
LAFRAISKERGDWAKLGGAGDASEDASQQRHDPTDGQSMHLVRAS